MNCKNCGAELQEGSAFCGNCGMKVEVEQPVYEAPAQPEFQQQGYYQAPAQPEYVVEPVAAVGEKPNTVLWIVLNAIEIFTCCTITGIVGLIFAILGHLAADKGDMAEANKKIKAAKTWFWVGLGVGALVVVAYIILVVIGAASGVASEMLYY